MKKILLFFVAFCLVYISNAQTISAEKNAALQLVSLHRNTIGISADDLNNVVVSNTYFDVQSGARLVYLQQTYQGVPVYNQIQVLAFKNNAVVSNAGGRIADVAAKVNVPSGLPAISAANAVLQATANKGFTTNGSVSAVKTEDEGRAVEFGKLGVSHDNITARLMWFPTEQGDLRLGWQVYFAPTTKSDMWLSKVDATNGTVIGADNLTVYCSWDEPKHRLEFGNNHNHKKSIYDNLFDFSRVNQKGAEQGSFGPSTVNNASYRVVPIPFEAPTFMPGAFPGTAPGNSTVVTNPWSAAPGNATTLGWHSTSATTDFSYTRGNNVWAYHDRGNANVGDSARSATSTTGSTQPLSFTYGNAPDYTASPITGGGTTGTMGNNELFNITNLFYFNNILHDVLYTVGFDEVSGNFQTNNLSRGGLGNDQVEAQAQDGSGTNNANFGTPPDGASGRMQMYLWTTATPNRDGDVDNGIVAHELGHGVSNRLFGGPANSSCVNNGEHQGEGISDYIALMTTQNWATTTAASMFASERGIGTYALAQATTGLGIRSQRFSPDLTKNTLKYSTTLPGAVHDRGERWCAAAWHATYEIINQSGVISPSIYFNGTNGNAGNVAAFRIAILAMKLAPCGSGFIDHRNGWLRADSILYNGLYSCAIREAFRARGMGYFAVQGSANSATDQTPDETAYSDVVSTATPSPVNAGTNLTYTHIAKTCSRVALTGYTLRDTLPANVSFVSATGGGTYDAATRIVTWVIGIPANGATTVNLTVAVSGAAFPGNVVLHTTLFANNTTTTLRFNTSSVVTPVGPVLAGCPFISQNPADVLTCTASNVTFGVTATALNTITYQWQVSSDNGVTWTNLANVAPYSNVNTNTLGVAASVALNNFLYRCFMTTVDCTAGITTASAKLNVVAASVGGTLSSNSATVCGATNTVNFTLAGQVGTILRWESSINGGTTWTPIANTTTTYTATNITVNTQYRVVVQVGGGCTPANSNVITINTLGSADLAIAADPGTTACVGDPVRLTGTQAPTVVRFSSSTSITIPSSGLATPYPSTINVTGLPANAVLTNVVVRGISHTFPADIDMALRAPSGDQVVLMSDAGGFAVMNNITYNFADSAAFAVLGTSLNPTGNYRPTNIGAGDAFPAPAGTTNTTTLAGLTGTPNGAWQLFILDDLGGDFGTVSGGYELVFSIPGGAVVGGTFTWSPATGLSSTNTNPVAATPLATTTYTLTHNTGTGCIRTARITLNINQRAIITQQPANLSLCENGTGTMTVAATGTGPLTYQWQIASGATWVNLSNAAPYSGVNSAVLTINSPAIALDGARYRCIAGGVCAPVAGSISNPAVLNVRPIPAVAINPAGPVCGGVAGINGTALNVGLPPIPGTRTVSSGTRNKAIPETPAFPPSPTQVGVSDTIAMAGIPANATVSNVRVTLNATHAYVADAVIVLKAPNGQVLNLSGLVGATNKAGANFRNTVISSAGVATLASANAPWTGTFKADAYPGPSFQAFGFAIPSGPANFVPTTTSWNALTSVANGNWIIAAYDAGAPDVGTLDDWSITIDYTTPDPNGANPNYSYTWSPINGLYTNATATNAYTAGTNATTVYAAPITLTNYVVTATNPAVGCSNSATVVVNYTPPAPNVVSNPTNMCFGDQPKMVTSSSSTTLKFSNTTPMQIIDNTPAGTNSSVTASGIPAGAPISGIKVRINGTHSWFGDVALALRAPNGDILNLSWYLNGTGAGPTTNFVNTVFSSTGTNFIGTASPFTGEFRADARPGTLAAPSGPTGFTQNTASYATMLANLNALGNANGVYTLAALDNFAGDAGVITNWDLEITYGVLSSKATWSPLVGLFNDPAGNQAYTGDERDTVYVRRNAPGTYNYDVTVNSVTAVRNVSAGNVTPAYGAANNGNALVTFNIKNNNSFPVAIGKLESYTTTTANGATARIYLKNTPVNGAPTAINAANGWSLAATNTFNATGGFPATVLNTMFTNTNIVIPAGAEYGVAVEAVSGATGVLGYFGTGAGPGVTTATQGGVTFTTGPNIGYGGAPAPAGPTFTVRGFAGSIEIVRPVFCTSPATKLVVNVWEPIVVTRSPVNAAACTSGQNNTASFTVAATGTTPTYQWQVSSTNANSWVNVANGANYSGATTATLTVINPPIGWDANLYRCQVSGAAPCAAAPSLNARLKVNPIPSVVITANPYTKLYPGLTTTLTSQSSPAGQTFAWTRDGFAAGGNTPQITVGVDGIGDYRVRVVDVNACANTSNLLTIGDSVSGKVFIYPNPNDGMFQVRYYSNLNNRTPRGLQVYDAKGNRVFVQNYPNVAAFQRMDVDIRKYGKGIYWVEIIDNKGERVAVGRAVVL
jgi:subtilisin-like proprotein convertase family protein